MSETLYCFIPDPKSSGHLFFNFVHIRNFLQKRMSLAGVHLFWMFENTTHMKEQIKTDICTALGCEPITLCPSSPVSMARERHFWDNLPAMYDLCTDTTDTMCLNLQDFLRPHRTANFQCSRTITTNKWNQKRGTRLPVTVNGREDYMNVNEIESLMGFRLHYTDACDLSIRQRFNFLAKGWCIPVVQKLLQTLIDILFHKG
ncbi:DNA (cytosine-5)-methyltransferase 3B-like [Frankliniella occidentalis]|uniref:DNA (Cytosine-5)-methyltransferase 3B-like n=1 Tax=Frankliniella occidentalis TaxID=133901 RepID=A0A9C6X749_FRAOC|nr:DNA (cytosine-5)-methyltransferase 3B-like [Frankliniella occidentalis]